MFPIIPLIALVAILGGGWTLGWYYSLPPEEQEEADRLGNVLAWELFNKTLAQLNRSEAKQVMAQVKQKFTND